MKETNTKLLYKTYPLLFKKNHIGFDCGDGWFILLDTLCSQISHLLKYEKKTLKIRMLQVKEKFAGLRFYYDITNKGKIADDEIFGYVTLAESFSYIICETCGKIKNKDTDVKVREGAWMSTLCDDCADVERGNHK